MEAEHLKKIYPTYPMIVANWSEDIFEQRLNVITVIRKSIKGTYYLIPCRKSIPFEGEKEKVDLTPVVNEFHQDMYKVMFDTVEVTQGMVVDTDQRTEKERLAEVWEEKRLKLEQDDTAGS